MKPIRWGVIGLGFFGEKHVEALAGIAGVELAAVCTRRPERLREIAQRYGVDQAYADHHDLLADDTVDAVSVTTHVNDHRDIAVDALNAGKFVFLEKPMAGTVEDCDAIIEAAGRFPKRLMVGHICRFDNRAAQAKEAIDAGRIGRVVSMHSSRNLPASIGAEVLDKVSPLMGDGVHDTDLMLWFTGQRVERVYARNIRVRDFTHPDIGWAMLEFENGTLGVIEVVWHLPETTPFTLDARMEIIGTEGAIYIDCGNTGLTIHDREGAGKPDTAYWPDLHGTRVGALQSELAYFARCIRRDDEPSVVTAREARRAVAVMCAAERSAAAGEVVDVPGGC